MKHDQGMLIDRGVTHRTKSLFVRCLYSILMYAAQFLRRARSSQSTNVQKERSMGEIPTDDEVLDALRASEDGLTPTALLLRHSQQSIRLKTLSARSNECWTGTRCSSPTAPSSYPRQWMNQHSPPEWFGH